MSAWGCPRCGTDANWATRSACRKCGADAPRKVLDAIASAAKRPKPAAPPQPRGQWKYGSWAAGGAWAAGPPGKNASGSRDNELAALHKELAALKKRMAGDESSAIDEEMPCATKGPSIEELVATLACVEKTYGAEHPITLAHRAHVDSARQARDAAKPAHLQIRNAERKAEAKQRAETKAAAAMQLAKEALSQAESDHREAEAAWTHAQEELAALRAKQLPKGTDAKAAGNDAMPPFSLPQEVLLMPGAAEQMAQLQEQFQKLQETATKWRNEQANAPQPQPQPPPPSSQTARPEVDQQAFANLLAEAGLSADSFLEMDPLEAKRKIEEVAFAAFKKTRQV